MTAEQMWELVMSGSDELADELGIEGYEAARALEAVEGWIGAHAGPLDEDETARLGCFLARVLVENHEGGLSCIEQAGHPLDGEWTITAFGRGLAADYQVPVFVSAYRLGVDRQLTARDWYAQLQREGKN